MASDLSPAKEVEVVSRIVRGDSYATITKETGVAPATISKIKKRQAEALATISGKLLQRKQKTAERLLDKTHQLLERRIDNALQYEEKLEIVDQKWLDELDKIYEENDDPEVTKTLINAVNDTHQRSLRVLREQFMSNTSLIALSREMYSEAKSDDEIDAPQTHGDSQAQLVALVDALKAGDEVKLQQIILNPKDND